MIKSFLLFVTSWNFVNMVKNNLVAHLQGTSEKCTEAFGCLVISAELSIYPKVATKAVSSVYMEARQQSDTLPTDFNRPTTNGIQLKTTTASDRKVLQHDDSVPSLSKKFSMMPSDQIGNLAP